MDNTNQSNQNPPTTPEGVAATPVTPPPAAQPSPVPQPHPTVEAAPAAPKSNSSKMWIIIAAFVIVAILIGVGIMMYSQVSQNNPDLNQVSTQMKDSVNELSTEVSNVVIEDVSADFTEVDSELSGL